MSIWQAIILGGLGCYALKLAGMSVPPSVLERPLVSRVAALMPVALLAALVVVQVFGGPDGVSLDARLAAMAAAVVALVLRAPFLAVVFISALTAALLRLLGLP